MGKIRCIFLFLMLSFGLSTASFAQKEPPPPQTRDHRGGPPCDPGAPSGNPNRPGVPPPPGLCLPIDDYVYLLMAVGVMYGCYKLRDVEFS